MNEELLRKTYAAFNARDIDTVLSMLDADVDWENGMEGGRVRGHDAVRAYWERQFGLIDGHVEPEAFEALPDGRVQVTVHQRVRDLEGKLLSDGQVQHVYEFGDDGLITRMQIREMTEESRPDPVELVRKQLEALNRGDVDGVMGSVTEDAVLEGRGIGDLFEGRAAVREFLEDWLRTFEKLHFELEEVSHLGGGVVFAVVISDGRLVGSDGHIRQREGWVYLCAGGSIARLTPLEVDQGRAAAERLAQERGL